MARFDANDLIFLDESIFNEKTGWRYHVYVPIGQPARYEGDMTRGKTWSIYAAMSLEGWLPCTGVREGYFNSEEFYNWIINTFLPAVRGESNGRMKIIVLDNVSVHTDIRNRQ
jgi:hypothetical protein